MSFNPSQPRDNDGKWTATGSLSKRAATVRSGGPLGLAGQGARPKARALGRVDTFEYYKSHRKEPRGKGSWAFTIGKPSYNDVTKEVMFVPGHRTHAKAAKIAARVAKGRNVYSQP